MTRRGTAHFVSRAAAFDYYRAYYPTRAATTAAVARKLADGEIHLGQPELAPGERLLTIDNGTRYAIEETTP